MIILMRIGVPTSDFEKKMTVQSLNVICACGMVTAAYMYMYIFGI